MQNHNHSITQNKNQPPNLSSLQIKTIHQETSTHGQPSI